MIASCERTTVASCCSSVQPRRQRSTTRPNVLFRKRRSNRRSLTAFASATMLRRNWGGGTVMTFRPYVLAIATVLTLGAISPAWAHHSFGVEYDANKPISLTGTVTEIEWTNPHCFIYI